MSLELFSAEWMDKFKEEWNKEPELAEALEKIHFDAAIGYGYVGEKNPQGIIFVQHGQATEGRSFREGDKLTWDLRATPKRWQGFMNKGLSNMGLGMAFTTGKLKIPVGDFGSMMKDPRMAKPFVASFGVMNRVHVI